MDISGDDLEVFLAVAMAGSVTGGASRLGLTQPAVTRALQKLERELQADLFIRSRTGVVLTRAGKHLSASAKRLLAGFEDVRSLLKEESEELHGTYSIGVHADLAGHTLPKFVARLLSENPNLELRLEHDLSREITRKVASLELDFGIVVNPLRYPDLTINKLYNDEVGFWVWKGSKWGNCTEREGTPIICNTDLTQTTVLIKQIRRKKLYPEPRLIHTTSLRLICDLTASGAGVGIMPGTSAMLYHKKQLRSLKDHPVHKDTICLVYRRDLLKGTAGHVIKEAIMEALG